MLRLALLFLVIALVAAVFGFWQVAWVGVDVARILALVFVALALIAFVGGSLRGPSKDIV